jgi:uncharacterized protein YrzB (UPF0473 family)
MPVHLVIQYFSIISETPEKLQPERKTPLKFKMPEMELSDVVLPSIPAKKQAKVEITSPVVASLVKIMDKNGKEKNKPVIHYCIFCPVQAKGKQKIVRHWTDKHITEEEVIEILATNKKEDNKSKQLRSKRIDNLKQRGDFR